jgi:hypothetical protein
MFSRIILLAVILSTVACAGANKMVRFEQDIEIIRKEVRNIRHMTDDMKKQLDGMQASISGANSNLKLQAEEIEKQKEYQTKLKGIVGSIKDTVVRLESEQLPKKKDELKKIKDENIDDSTPLEGFVVKTEQEGSITKIITEKKIRIDTKDTPKKKQTPFPETKSSGFGYAVKDGVILWQYPARNSDVLEILVSWQQLNIIGRVENQGIKWLKIKTNDYTGYVNSKFVIVSE